MKFANYSAGTLLAAVVFTSVLILSPPVKAEIAYDDFFPLVGCKTEPIDCVKYSELAGMVYVLEEELFIPCDVCLNMIEFRKGESLTLNGGIRVEGLLYIPADANLTISTPYVVVEGKVILEANDVIDYYPEIIFEMTGDENYHFVPNEVNEIACEDTNDPSKLSHHCDFGKKVFAVAGGSVDIRGIPDTCPTWVNLLDVKKATPRIATNYTKPTPAPDGCSRVVFTEDFNSDRLKWKGSLGTMFQVVSEDSHDGTPYMRSSYRKRDWQGVFMVLADYIDCIKPDEEYLFRAKIKLESTKLEENSTCSSNITECPLINIASACSTIGTDCPSIKMHTLTGRGALNWRTMHRVAPVTVPENEEWFDYTALLTFTAEDLRNDHTYHMLYIGGMEAGVDLSIDDIQLELPPLDGYHAPDNVCGQMVVNGGAKVDPFHPFPQTVYGNWEGALSISHNSAENSSHYVMKGRTENWNSVFIPFPRDCIEEHAVYHFTAKVWVQDVRETTIRLNLWGETEEGVPSSGYMGRCGKVGEKGKAFNINSGWVECSRYIIFQENDFEKAKLGVFFVTEERNVTIDGPYPEMWYKDFSFVPHSEAADALILPSAVAECWGPGAEIMITSHTMELTDTTLRNITDVTVEGDHAIVTLSEKMQKHTTVADSPNYAVEVALLSRNIRFTQANDDEVYDNHGGHMMIVRTPNVKQHIQGVEFHQFGQQGMMGKYPFHYHLSHDNPESYIGKNMIRDSFQRCIVLHGTHNITIAENIAYDTFGHCFMVEDGFEQDNMFYRNLGALTKITPDIGVLSVTESDMFASTFWISNPKNHFIENVCAGSEDTGFWYEFQQTVRGPSSSYDPLYTIDPSAFDFGSHKRNVVHSNQGDGFKLYPNGYFPATEAVYYDMRSYRNKGDGVLLHNSAKLAVEGGIFADNRVQVEVDKQADAVRVSNATMIGYSPEFMYAVESLYRRRSHCPAYRALVGVQLHSFLRYKDSDGYIVENIHFEGFGESMTGCVGSTALQLDPQVREGTLHYDAYAIFRNLTFEEEAPLSEKFNICELEANGIKDLAISDESGDLNPVNPGSLGWIVSNHTTMTTFLDGDCHHMHGSCALFCEGDNICYRALNFAVSQALEYDNLVLRAIDEKDRSFDFYGYFERYKHIRNNTEVLNTHDNYIYQRRRYFTPVLPAGHFYTLQFVDYYGEPSWPTFVEKVWENPPGCTGYIDNSNIELIETPPTEQECNQIIKHHDLEEGTLNHWMHSGGSLKIVEPGHESSYALSSEYRKSSWQGPAQFLDSRCVEVGQQFEISVRYRLELNGTFVACNPASTAYLGADVCPRATFRMRHVLSDEIGAEVDSTYTYPVANPVAPVSADNWNLLVGIYTVSEELATADTVLLIVERGRGGQNIIVDDVTMTRISDGCGHSANNRDFESGDSRFWSAYGAVEIDMVSPGDGGSQFALATTHRDAHWASMTHEIDAASCLHKGTRYGVSVNVKLVNRQGGVYQCYSSTPWAVDATEVCPTLSVKVVTGGLFRTDDVSVTIGQWDNGEWNTLYGVFTATDEIMNADSVIFFFSKFDPLANIIVDNLTYEELEDASCDRLILNGGAEEGDPRFWKSFGSSNLFVESGGASKYSNYNLIVQDRASANDGVLQMIDTSCLTTQDVYTVKAMVRMFDNDGTTPVGCDRGEVSDGIPSGEQRSQRCPLISLLARSVGPYQIRYIGAAKEEWETDGWNVVRGTFTLFENEIDALDLAIIIHRGPQNTILHIDDVQMTRLNVMDREEAIDFFQRVPTPPPSDPPTDLSSDAPSESPLSSYASGLPSVSASLSVNETASKDAGDGTQVRLLWASLKEEHIYSDKAV